MFTNNVWRKQNLEKKSRWLHLNFNILSETFLDFVYIYLVLEIKNTVNLIKSELCELFKPGKLYGMVYIANFTITLIQMVSIFQSMETHGCDFARSWVLKGFLSFRVLDPQGSWVLKSRVSSRILNPLGYWIHKVLGALGFRVLKRSWLL